MPLIELPQLSLYGLAEPLSQQVGRHRLVAQVRSPLCHLATQRRRYRFAGLI
jgi:hypothetical protein